MTHRGHTIFTDIHLGSPYSNPKTFLEVLKQHEEKRIVIGGDLFDKEGSLTDEEFQVIEYFRQHRDRIIYIEGNHDPIEQGMVRRLLSQEVLQSYIWQENGKKFCVMHGHQFGNGHFIFNVSWIDTIFVEITKFIKKINIDVLILGHVHQPLHRIFIAQKGRTINYYNCGSFLTYDTCSYITVDENGTTLIHYVLKQ